MASNISTTLSNWSSTAGSNQPDSTDLASTLREDLQAIQAAVRYLRTSGTIASASTTDLSTKAEEILSVSGTTTIAALGTVSAGMIKVLVFEGALTLTHNGTSLIIPTAANITTAAGDVAVMLSLGSGNWRCIGYEKASGQPVNAAVSVASVSATGAVTGGSLVSGNASYTQDVNNATLTFDTGDSLTYARSGNAWTWRIGGTAEMSIDGLAIYPSVTDGMTCGASGFRWSAVHATNGTIQTSDKREKDHITQLADCGATIDALEPVRFAWKKTGRVDLGFYAQDVAPLVPEACTEPKDETERWGFQPDRLIALLVAEIQALRARVAALEGKQ